jgi:hypothetical protein
MKHQLFRVTGIFCFMLLAVMAMAGTWSTNNFFYQPALDARGAAGKSNFDTGLNRVDAHLGKYKTSGDPGYSTLAEALTTIGSTNVTLTIPTGTITIADNTTIGSNIALRVFKGGKFSVNSGITLTINGPIDAGPYQIFSGSGAVALGGVSTIYDAWYVVPPSNPEGTITSPIGSRFVKTSGSPPLVYVKESGTGNTGWVASSGGSGATAFTGLNDVPGSYSGQAGKALRVNANSNGLEFYAPSSSGVKPFITYGETGYLTLSQALSTIGSTHTTMIIPAETGTIPITSNTTIPTNVDLRVMKGAKFDVANGVTLTINGSIEAGPYQIFSWTGTGAIDISNSPTIDCFLQWWGALDGKSNNVSGALAKAVASVGSGHVIHITRGEWRLATPVSFNPGYHPIRIKGDSVYDTAIYVDVGAGNNGLDIGNPNVDEGWFEMSDITFGGPASCCTSALVLRRIQHVKLDRVNFWLGCTGYALDIQSCIWLKGCVYTRGMCFDYGSYGECGNGVRVASTTNPPYQSNALDLRVILQAFTSSNGIPLRLDGSVINNGVARITGTIENYSGKPIYVTGWDLFNIQELYVEGNGAGPALFENCRDLSLVNFLLNDTTCNLKFVNCKRLFLNNFSVNSFEIDPQCRGSVVGSGQVWGGGDKVKNYAPDTQFIGKIVSGVGLGENTAWPVQGPDRQNIMYNSLFTCWQADRPDLGWGTVNNTWEKCGDGQTDTTKHLTPFCAKVVTSGGDGWVYYNFDSTQLQRMLGQHMIYSLMAKFLTGQANLKTEPLYLFANISVPNWSASTKYQVNDGARPTAGGGKRYICMVPGTTGASEPAWPDKSPEWSSSTSVSVGAMRLPVGGNSNFFLKCTTAGTTGTSEPTWPTDEGLTVTDGSVVWTRYNLDGYRITDGSVVWAIFEGSNSASARYQGSGAGTWQRCGLGFFVPNNATSVNILHLVYRRTDSSESNCYFAEPALMVGTQSPTAVIPNQNEVQDFMMVSGHRIDWGTAVPVDGRWCSRGDVRYNSNASLGQTAGWMCTTPGTAGGSAVWKAMSNLAN